MAKDTGGAAYPSRGGMMFYVPAENKADIEQAVTSLDQEYSGMTLRDYFAGQALAGISAHPIGPSKDVGETGHQAHARWSYSVADAMLAQRSKP